MRGLKIRYQYDQSKVPPACPSDRAWAEALLLASNRCLDRRPVVERLGEEVAREQLDWFRQGRQ